MLVTILQIIHSQADPILNLGHLIAPVATQFTVSAAVGGASTISSPSASFANSGIKTGDIIQYSVAGNSVPTFNRVTGTTAIAISLEQPQTLRMFVLVHYLHLRYLQTIYSK